MKKLKLTCSGKICTSTEDTLIDGEKIRFYEIPTDKKLKLAWKKLVKVPTEDDKVKQVLCELHFDKNCFTNDKQLKPDSIPTFASQNNSCSSPKFSSAYDEPSPKKTKSENAPENNKSEENKNETKEDQLVTSDNKPSAKKVKPYRLTVQIDKICLKPCPKSKRQPGEIKVKFISPRVSSELYESLGQSIELRNGKELPAYNQCLVCKKVFLNATHLYSHLKLHFTCDICKMEFTSKKSHGRHYKIHENESVEFPFKCHICNAVFNEKGTLRAHEHIKRFPKDPETKVYNCKECNITFKNDNTYKRHLVIHKQESKALADLKHIKVKAVPAQEKPAVEFDCRICHKKLSNIAEVESHSKTHTSDKSIEQITL